MLIDSSLTASPSPLHRDTNNHHSRPSKGRAGQLRRLGRVVLLLPGLHVSARRVLRQRQALDGGAVRHVRAEAVGLPPCRGGRHSAGLPVRRSSLDRRQHARDILQLRPDGMGPGLRRLRDGGIAEDMRRQQRRVPGDRGGDTVLPDGGSRCGAEADIQSRGVASEDYPVPVRRPGDLFHPERSAIFGHLLEYRTK